MLMATKPDLTKDRIEISIEEKKPEKNVIENGVINYNRKFIENWHPKTFCLLAKSKNEIIGGITGEMVHIHLKLDWLWVREDHRGFGLGRKIYLALERYARHHVIEDIQLDTADFQAKGFYEKLGFKVMATLPNWVGPYDCYIMRKKLY